MGSASARAAQADHRSVRLQEVLRARWRDETNRKPPAEREKFLRSTEGIVAVQCNVWLYGGRFAYFLNRRNSSFSKESVLAICTVISSGT